MVQASEAQKRASRAWYEKNKEANAVERKAKYAENADFRQKFRNNAKRNYYRRKLAELDDSSGDSDTGIAPLEEIHIERPPTPPNTETMYKLNTFNYII